MATVVESIILNHENRINTTYFELVAMFDDALLNDACPRWPLLQYRITLSKIHNRDSLKLEYRQPCT